MKKIKKLFGLLLISCMLCMNFSMMTYAATAELRFTDPETTVGAEVEVTATFTATYPVQGMDATLSYDTSKLRFVSGSQVTDNNGTLSITGGDGTKVVTVTMTFQALEEGTTVLSVTSSDGVDTDGDPIEIVNGKSTIEIGPGDPSLIKSTTNTASVGTLKVDVDGVSYTLVEDFTDLVIPEGFERSELELDGGVHTVVKQTTSDTILAYLQPAEGDADFFLYNADNATFSQFEQAELATGRYLIFMNDVSGVKVPADFVETTITLSESGKTFPAWQSTSEPDFYLVYGLNSDGNKALYTYDTIDGTYQRLQDSALTGDDEEDAAGGKITNKLLGKLGNLMDVLIVVVVAVILFMLILLIVIAIKLRHRNLELDDLYDEYGIDLDEEDAEEEPVKETRADRKARKKEEKQAKKNKKYDDDLYDFDDEDDEYDDYEESEYEDYDDAEDDYEEAFSDYNASDYEDDSDIDDLDAMLNARVQKRPERKPMVTVAEPRPKQVGHSDPCDTFKMDLIDLD